MRVKKELREFHLSVKDLIFATENTNYATSSIPYSIRASKGTEIHQNYQEKREKSEKNFKKEVAVKIKSKVDDWTFIISGRADCVYNSRESIIIEEIKSVSSLKNTSIDSKTIKDYKQQLLIYAHYFNQLQSEKGKKIKCKLVLVDIFTEEIQDIEVPLEDLTDYIKEQCKNILEIWNKENLVKLNQRKRARSIKFPFSTYRPNQEEIIEHTNTILKNNGRLILSAPSGLGKTIGTLFPALKYALRKNLRLFIITSKTTQQKIYRDTLRILAKKGGNFQSIILTAKEKMCINSAYICEKNFCPYIENYEQTKLKGSIEELLSNKVITARNIKKIAKKIGICPFELSLDCSLFCDVIVGDYNYVFHPFIKLKRFFDRSYDNSILIIDEAHNLPFRATNYYSPEITLQDIQDCRLFLNSTHVPKDVESQGVSILKNLSNYIMNLIDVNQNSNQKKMKIERIRKKYIIKIHEDFFRKQLKEYDQFILKYFQAYTQQNKAPPSMKDKIIEFSMNLRQFYIILKESNCPEFTQLCYIKERKIKILCKSAAPKLEKQIKGFHSVIAQSATLFPMNYHQNMMGFPSQSLKIELNSPFARENRLYLQYPHVSTKYDYREGSYGIIAEIISKTVNIQIGNYIAFFPSFAYLKAVLKEIERNNPQVEILVQESRMNERKRREYLKKLNEPNGNYLLLAVHGGIFGEGVDFTGDMAIGAFIIGPGLPAYSLEQELIKNYFDFKWKKGFEYAYRNIGMTKVIQAAGRIFRTDSDKGIVILIGQRFNTPYYNKIIPKDWNLENAHNLIQTIEKFWESHKNHNK
ncbi:MAG: helicase C-terminal domain-containing protein [Promethearchaeota archaeon]